MGQIQFAVTDYALLHSTSVAALPVGRMLSDAEAAEYLTKKERAVVCCTGAHPLCVLAHHKVVATTGRHPRLRDTKYAVAEARTIYTRWLAIVAHLEGEE